MTFENLDPAKRCLGLYCGWVSLGRGESVFAPGLRALRSAWMPMLLIQSVLVAVVLGYYFWEPVAGGLGVLADWKDKGGVFTAVLVGFFSGGILPEVAKGATGRLKRLDRGWVKDTLYTGFVYAVIAVCVWYLYLILEGLFGPTVNGWVLFQKVLVDQLVFSPFLSIPLAFHLFGWRDERFGLGYFKNLFDWPFYKKHVAPPLVMCWAFWGPAVTCIYLFPERLQFVISALCQGAWSLLFVLMVRGRDEEDVVH